jgi:thioredoxin-related protein
MRLGQMTFLALPLALLLTGACGKSDEGSEARGSAASSEQTPEMAGEQAQEGIEAPPDSVHAESGLEWMSYAEGVARAKAEGRFVLIDFWTSWCHWCKVMDRETYADELVLARLRESFVAIKVDAESRKPQGAGEAMNGRDLAGAYQVGNYPTTWFVDSEGAKIAPLSGYMPPKEFIIVLDFIATGAYRSQTFQDYKNALSQG